MRISYDEPAVSQALIVGITDCGEQICAASGRISTQEGDAMEILAKSQDLAKNADLIQKVTRSGHNSTVEHAFFNIAFLNVSAVVEQFMIEFRLASFTVKSRRYVDFSKVGYYIPPELGKPELTCYCELMDSLFSAYGFLLEQGIPKEDARFVLPYCFFSNFYCSMNARELLHVLRAMLFGRGSRWPEIRALGEQLAAQAKKLAPGIFAALDHADPAKDQIDLSFLSGTARRKAQAPVELLAGTPDAESVVARTAVIAEKQMSAAMLEALLSDKGMQSRVIDAVMESSRPRPLEHVQYTFRLNGVSLSGITHLVRHRMQAVQVPPLTKVRRESYLIPASVETNELAATCYTACFTRAAEAYQKLRQMEVPESLLAYTALSGNTLDIVTTMNGRELLLFMQLRTCTRAQWEIREYALEMLRILRKEAPGLFLRFGPSCYARDCCPEGRLSCGRVTEMRAFFQQPGL